MKFSISTTKQILKSISGLTLLTLFMFVLASPQAYGQRNQPRKDDKVKVVTPAKRTGNSPARGTQVVVLPQRTTKVAYRNQNYHYQNGTYYRPVNNNYVVVAPPIGLRVAILPVNFTHLHRGDRDYYYYNSTYYLPLTEGGYEVTDIPIGAITDTLPEGYEKVELDGMVYYRMEETYYKAVLEPNGNVAYEVIRV